MKNIHLLIIDPQNDFCNPSGSLFVPGADKDMKRLSVMIERLYKKINSIHITLDYHHMIDIAHAIMWKDKFGRHPESFTIITYDDIKNGKWTPSVVKLRKRYLSYAKELERSNRYPLCIWPEHCLIGSNGCNIVPELFEKITQWQMQNLKPIDYIHKGFNIHTEHYSAIKAEVIDPDDPMTHINYNFIKKLNESDILLVAGEAGSHCLANTVKDIVAENESLVKKMVLLIDAMSAVPNFQYLQNNFINEMIYKGMKISTTMDFKND